MSRELVKHTVRRPMIACLRRIPIIDDDFPANMGPIYNSSRMVLLNRYIRRTGYIRKGMYDIGTSRQRLNICM